jgi:opacity protein-like surface antigen
MWMPAKLLKRPLVVRFSAVALFGVLAGGLPAQQTEPAVEVFGLAGGYVHGNLLLSPQSLSTSSQWRPQLGGGILVPLGRNWGALFDVTTSALETNWKWDGLPGAGPLDNFTHVRRVSLVPSVVRLWRRNRFSIYTGGGVGFEHDRQASRFRPILARDDRGQPILGNEFTDHRANKTQAALAFRAGVIVSLSRRLVARSGYSYLRRYTDERGSAGLEAGIGYRF